MTTVLTMEPIRSLVDSIDLWDPRRHADPDHEFDYIDISSVNREAKCVNGLTRTCVTGAPSRARQRVQAGDVLVSTVRPNLNAVAVVPAGLQDGTASTGFCVLRPQAKRLDARYLFYWVRTPQFIDTMTRLATGASYPAITDRTILDSQIPLPPSIEEQRRIAGILDEADALRGKRAEAIRLANDLVPSLFYEMFGDPRVNIHRWEMLALAEVVDPNRPITYGILKPGDYEPGGIPMIRIQDIRGSEIDISTVHRVAPALSMQYKRTVLQGVEILISLVGTIGLLTRVSENLRGANVHRNLGVIVPGIKIRRDYLFWLLKASPLLISSAMKGGVQSLLNLGDLEKLRVPVPPVEAQDQFCRVASEGERVVEQCIVTEAEFDNLFHSLLQRAFRGEL